MQRARDRRGRHREHIDLLAHLLQAFLVPHPKALFFIDDQQTEILQSIAYRQKAEADETLKQGIEFFALLRKLTVGAFFTSRIGMNYLGYMGNTYLQEFPGCPVPPGWPASKNKGHQQDGGENE